MPTRRRALFAAATAAATGLASAPRARGQGAAPTIGFISSLTGSGASIGIPYQRGIQTAVAYAAFTGQVVPRVVLLDDASDTTTAARNARKLVEEERADVLIGTAGAPSARAIAGVAAESRTLLLAVTPLPAPPPTPDGPWCVAIPQPPALMVDAAVGAMKRAGVRRVAYIGFSDAWGDLVYDALVAGAAKGGIEVVANERYARADASVMAQVLKSMATRPDAVMNGGSGTPGALPFLALKERGFGGGMFGTHALINPDFIRIASGAADGLLAPTGPVIVAEQLPEGAPTRDIGLAFRAAFARANPDRAFDAFSAYAFDAWLVFARAAKRAMATEQPGTPGFRKALRDAVLSGEDLVGTHGVYRFTPDDLYGVDERARVIVRLEQREWKLASV